MELGIAGRIALVAGASKGLGLAAARALGEEGARVAICSRSADHLKQASGELRAAGIEVLALRADVSRPQEAIGFVQQAFETLGGVHILVTNAGGPPALSFMDIESAAWEEAFRLTLLSTITLIRAALPAMQRQRWGRIINLSSVAVKQPIDGLLISNTLRPGVIGLAKSLSPELAPLGITINNVLPGYFRTQRVEQLACAQAQATGVSASEVVARWEDGVPAGRLGRPAELGSLVAFLASEPAAYITGTSIQIDGGYCRGIL